MIVIFLSLFGLASSSILGEFIPYTKVAVTTDGKQCLGGCLSTSNECVVNLAKLKRSCVSEDKPAPIYFTSQVKDKNSKYCLSNCGKFGTSYEWCVTTSDFKWDYCSSKSSSIAAEAKKQVYAYTKVEKLCTSKCFKNNCTDYYWCYYKNHLWSHCAPPAISRVPVLHAGYNAEESHKGSCKAFLKSLDQDNTNYNHELSTANDNFISDTADAIETVATMSSDPNFSVVETNNDDISVKKYTLAKVVLGNGTNVQVPAVIRARVSKDILRNFAPMIDVRAAFDRMENENGLYESYYYKRLLAFEIGGPDEGFNYIPQSAKLSEDWGHVIQGINNWCAHTGGSVDVVIVIFYPDSHTIVPRAIGAALTFNDVDGNVFVHCKDTIYWNNL